LIPTAAPTVGIMQPTYFPWAGYFDIMDQSDIFVLLDSVQFTARSWQQRNRIKTPTGPRWLTVPVLSKGRRYQNIPDVRIDPASDFGRRHLETIRHCYRRAPFFKDYFGNIAAILARPHERLVDLNVEIIEWIRQRLGIRAQLVRSSTLGIESHNVQLLVDICKAVHGSRYLSTPGSHVYIDKNNLFPDQGIELVYHAFSPPTYRQLHGGFTPRLSILDLLMNEGPVSAALIRSGRRPSRMAEEIHSTLILD